MDLLKFDGCNSGTLELLAEGGYGLGAALHHGVGLFCRPRVGSRELLFPEHTHLRDLFTKAGRRFCSQAQDCCWLKWFFHLFSLLELLLVCTAWKSSFLTPESASWQAQKPQLHTEQRLSSSAVPVRESSKFHTLTLNPFGEAVSMRISLKLEQLLSAAEVLLTEEK